MSPPAICCGTTPSLLITWPAKPPMRNFRPLRSSTLLISLRNQPPICAPVLPHGSAVRRCSPCRTRSSARSPPPHLIQAFCWRVFSAERHGRAEGEGRVLAEVVVGRGVAHLDGAVLHGVEHLQARHDLAGGEDADLELVVGQLADVLGEELGPRRTACRATWESSTSERHFSSGIDWAMAGAASVPAMQRPPPPSAAVRRNLRRCMMFLPGRFLFADDSTERNQPAMRTMAAANKKPRRSGAFRDARLPQSLSAADWRAMKLSKVFSADAEPQDLLVPERLPVVVDLLELRVLRRESRRRARWRR